MRLCSSLISLQWGSTPERSTYTIQSTLGLTVTPGVPSFLGLGGGATRLEVPLPVADAVRVRSSREGTIMYRAADPAPECNMAAVGAEPGTVQSGVCGEGVWRRGRRSETTCENGVGWRVEAGEG
jgi:hypothetical protein